MFPALEVPTRSPPEVCEPRSAGNVQERDPGRVAQGGLWEVKDRLQVALLAQASLGPLASKASWLATGSDDSSIGTSFAST